MRYRSLPSSTDISEPIQGQRVEVRPEMPVRHNIYASDTTIAPVDADSDEKGLLISPGQSASAYTNSGHNAQTPEKHRSIPQPLPLGAMPPQKVPAGISYVLENDANVKSPLDSPSANLLNTPSPNQVQFATYTPSFEKSKWKGEPLEFEDEVIKDGWTPIPLRPWFWAPLVVAMVIAAICLEVALYECKKHLGWPVLSVFAAQTGIMHFVYTLPPVGVAMIVVSMWAWTDIEIKRLQPYLELLHGNSTAKSSLLLDYTRAKFIVWTEAVANRHYLVVLGSLVVLIGLAFQPLAAAMFSVESTWFPRTGVTINSTATIGLNQNSAFQDLTSFLTAAGFAAASVQYDLGDPSFIYDGWTIAPFQIPYDITKNGTVYANTTAVQSEPNCSPGQVSMTQFSNQSGWTNSASFNNCSYTWEVEKTTSNLFGTSVITDCGGGNTPPQFSPVVFWFFTYVPKAAASTTFCIPSISFWNVSVTVDVASGNVTEVTPITQLQEGQSVAANITGSPLFGRAYNGIGFNLTDPDQFVIARANATQLLMPAAIFERAELSSQSLPNIFTSDEFPSLSSEVYLTYLQLVAQSVYFLPTEQPMKVTVKSVEQRLWLSKVAVHLLTASLLLLALLGTILNLLHREDRRGLHLYQRPGTIASAMSLGARTNISNFLDGRQRPKDVARALEGKKVRINPKTLKIVMEGEEGYDDAVSPDARKSIFETLGQSSKRFSRRLSTLVSPSKTSTP